MILVLQAHCRPRDDGPAMARLVLREWTLALREFAPDVLIEAARRHALRSKFWPSTFELQEAARQVAQKLAVFDVPAAAGADWADDHPQAWAMVKAALGGPRWAAWLARCSWDAAARTLVCPDRLSADQAEWRYGGVIRAFVGDIKFVVMQ